MDDYRGNVFADMEHALAKGQRGLTLTADQMRQVLSEFAALVEAKNAMVRASHPPEVVRGES